MSRFSFDLLAPKEIFMEQRSYDDFQNDVTNGIDTMPNPKPNREKNMYDYCFDLAKKIKKDVLNGKSGFLPNEKGEIDIKFAYNMSENKWQAGLAQLALLHRMGELGVTDTGAFVTDVMVKKAIDAGVDTDIIKGQLPVKVPLQTDGELVVNSWYHISQIKNPENLKSYLSERMTLDAERVTAYNQEHHPDRSPKNDRSKLEMDRPNTKVMNLSAYSACQYIAQVMAASQSGIRLRVTPEQVEQFKTNLVENLESSYNERIDKLAIQKLANDSIKVCKSIKQKLYLKDHPQQKQNQEQKKASPRRQREEPSMSR